jgi:hypothetical protein
VTTSLPTESPVGRPALGLLRARILGAPAVSKKRKAIALTAAVLADLLQIVLFPVFGGGAASPFDDALDVAVALTLLLTLGWSGRLALALAIELVPGADLFPSWTAVVLSIPTREEPARGLNEAG